MVTKNEAPWWREGVVHKRQLLALNSEYLADCSFHVGKGNNSTTFRCNSTLLSFASPTLAEKLQKDKTQQIVIDYVDPSNFRKLLELIYTDTTELNDMESTIEVGTAAYFLDIKPIAMRCAEKARSYLNISNVCDAWMFGQRLGDVNFKEVCTQFLCKNVYDVIRSDQWPHVDITCLESILSQDNLYNVTELELFSACYHWAQTRTNTSDKARDLLRSALSLIRFRTLTVHEFGGTVCPTGLLTAHEESIIFQCLAGGKSDMPPGFSKETNPRGKPAAHLTEIDIFSAIDVAKSSTQNIRAVNTIEKQNICSPANMYQNKPALPPRNYFPKTTELTKSEKLVAAGAIKLLPMPIDNSFSKQNRQFEARKSFNSNLLSTSTLTANNEIFTQKINENQMKYDNKRESLSVKQDGIIYSNQSLEDEEKFLLVGESGKRQWAHEMTYSLVRFSVNSSTFLIALEMEATRYNTVSYEEKFSVVLRGPDNGNYLSVFFKGNVTHGQKFMVKFEPPCALSKNVCYEIMIHYMDLNTQYECKNIIPGKFKSKYGLELRIESSTQTQIHGICVGGHQIYAALKSGNNERF